MIGEDAHPTASGLSFPFASVSDAGEGIWRSRMHAHIKLRKAVTLIAAGTALTLGLAGCQSVVNAEKAPPAESSEPVAGGTLTVAQNSDVQPNNLLSARSTNMAWRTKFSGNRICDPRFLTAFHEMVNEHASATLLRRAKFAKDARQIIHTIEEFYDNGCFTQGLSMRLLKLGSHHPGRSPLKGSHPVRSVTSLPE